MLSLKGYSLIFKFCHLSDMIVNFENNFTINEISCIQLYYK